MKLISKINHNVHFYLKVLAKNFKPYHLYFQTRKEAQTRKQELEKKVQELSEENERKNAELGSIRQVSADGNNTINDLKM